MFAVQTLVAIIDNIYLVTILIEISITWGWFLPSCINLLQRIPSWEEQSAMRLMRQHTFILQMQNMKGCILWNTWWRHQMETFYALLAICAGNSPVPGEFPAQRPVTRSFDVFCGLHPNKRLSKRWWGWWFETPPSPLWRHCNEMGLSSEIITAWLNGL